MVILKEEEKTACHQPTPPNDDRGRDGIGRIQTPFMRALASGFGAFGRCAGIPYPTDFADPFTISSSVPDITSVVRANPGRESI
jgi:hypothetical protein